MAPSPKVADEGPPVPTLDSGAILNLEPILEETNVYMPREEVKIDLVFRNASSESIAVAQFPPAIQIKRSDTNEVVRSFAPGSESAEISAAGTLSYALVWNQLDDRGQQVEPGRYSIIVSDVTIQKGTEPREARAGFAPVIELIIQPP